MEEPIVQVKQGKLKGIPSKTSNNCDYFTFRGIPYAKPPVGELRFSIPQPPQPWEGIRDAIENCNICSQFDHMTSTVIGDEDCLYLNVYTPKLPPNGLLPVMVLFHGGGFLFGNGTDDCGHGPDYLVVKDVVVVGINYRLGILGFLSLDRKEAPGNMGLMDQVQALKWIQENIKQFSGDPNNVTIFGFSAGAASVEYLLLSHTAKGLFHKAIAASGSSLLHWAHNNDVRKLASKIPELNNKVITGDDELLNYLKSLPTDELISASMSALMKDEHRGGIHFGFVPTIEKPGDWEPFLSQPPYKILSKGEFNKVPYMTGFCTREGLLMLILGQHILKKLESEKDFINHLPFDVNDNEKADIEQRLKDAYVEEDKTQDAEGQAVDFFTDVDFLGGIYVAAKLIAKNNAPVYLYEFSYDGNLNYIKKTRNIDREGACHGDDGGYIVKIKQLSDPLTGNDEAVREVMTTMWSNFAKNGNPTPKTDHIISTIWEPLTESGLACLNIDKTVSMKHDVYPQRMRLYEHLYENNFKKA